MQDHILIKGARENNLKNIDVTIPRDKLVVLHRTVRVGQVLPGLRYPLCRGATAVCGVSVLLRPACFWARWKSRMWTISRA